MSVATLLVELVTEELPPKALPRLGETFAQRIFEGLASHGLADAAAQMRWFAAPRRIAVSVPAVRAEAAAREVSDKIMPVSVGLDAEGRPTPALLKKLAAKGIAEEAVADFERRMDGKAEALFYTRTEDGARLADVLAQVVQEAVKALPIPKLMRWGASDVQFVRPVHRLVMLHGDAVVPGEVLGLQAGRITLGHRFMSRGEIELASADAYEPALLAEGKVVPDFMARREDIARQLHAAAASEQASLGDFDDLLDEVCALVEHPTVYVGEFEREFLEVPQECLILTMRANQKYFPLFDPQGRLLNRFLIVSNMRVSDPGNIIAGNQRVVRPRLADARFFLEQDKRHGFASRALKLGGVVYHNRLGSLGERVERLASIARTVGERLGAPANLAERAALVMKADLLSEMVGEFPELQGVMGRYYALHEGLSEDVANAVEQHYWPRFAGDRLPEGLVACAVALADKLESLTGFFGIGELPTGDRDPFGLRRAALGVLRILMEKPLPLDLGELIDVTAASFHKGVLTQAFKDKLLDFMFERLRNLLRDAGHAPDAIDAVIALRPTRIDLVLPRLNAVRSFQSLPEAAALAAANKRIVNILRKVEGALPAPSAALLSEPVERALFEQLAELTPQVLAHLEGQAYTEALTTLAGLREAVDSFFDSVMVMAEDPAVRANRLGLLRELAGLMNGVADISRLSAA